MASYRFQWTYLFLLCSADVLDIADRMCSGRHRCEIPIPNEDFERTRPCYRELKSHLEASYACVKGLSSVLFHIIWYHYRRTWHSYTFDFLWYSGTAFLKRLSRRIRVIFANDLSMWKGTHKRQETVLCRGYTIESASKVNVDMYRYAW